MQPTTHRVENSLIPAGPFVALDFETADYGSDSACALALVRVEGSTIVARQSCLIRPPRMSFTFSYIHGITWRHVKDQPVFADLWPGMAGLLNGAAFVAAHNSGFDRNVLRTCCEHAQLPMPANPFVCTVRISRKIWKLRSAKLPDVCRHLGLPLRHHDAASDAEACARIVIAARESLWPSAPLTMA